MTIEKNHRNGNLYYTLSGRLDSTTADDLSTVLESEIGEDTLSVTFGLKDVDFISSKGLRVLVSTYRKLNGKELILVAPNPSVTEVIRLSGLLKIFTVKEA